MANYYLMNWNSESVAKTLATPNATPTAATNSQTVVASGTNTVSFITSENLPSNTSWGTRAISATFKITTANTNVQYAITPYRVNAAGAIQDTGTQSAFVTASAIGNITCTCTAFAFTAGSATDRLAVDVAVHNTNSMTSQSAAFEVNTVNSFFSSPVPEWSGSTPGTVVASGQYANNYSAAVAVGAATGTDGNSTPLWLETDIYSKAPAYATTAGEESEQVGTSFSNSADITNQSRSLRELVLPTSRRGAVMGYDSINHRCISVGGYDGTTRYSDLWELSADSAYSRFHLLAPTGSAPTPKNLGTSVMLCANAKAWFIYWGGANSSGTGLNDMTIADCSTRGSESWTTVTQTNAPSARDYNTHMMIARPTGATTFDVYLWGGWTQAGPRANDMYKCSLDLSSAVPSSLTWTTITQTGAPTARSGACIVYDSVNDRGIMFGGYDGTTYLADLHAFNFSTNTWTSITPTGSAPSGRELASCGYDATNKRLIVFGGWNGVAGTNNFNDIVAIGLTTGAETIATIRANTTANMALFPFSSGSACVDTNRNIIVEFGQNGYDSTDKYLYAFDLNNTDTSNAPIYGLNVIDDLRGRDAPGFAVDTTRSVAVLSNGYSTMADDSTITLGDHHNQIWAYNWSNNSARYANSGYLGIVYREGVLLVYDSTGDRFLQFGGLVGTSQVTNEIWELKADAYGNYKARMMKPAGSLPGARWLMAGAYDATRNRLVIWGGENATTMIANTDMWQLDLSSGDGTWSSLSPTGTPPPAVWQPSYAMDNTNHKLYIAAGSTAVGDVSYSSRLDVLDLTNATPAWSNKATTGITAVRGGHLGVDVTNQYLWFFGGYNGTVVNNTLAAFNLAGSSWTTVTATGGPPEARRSGGYFFVNNKFYVTCGRPVSGRWYSNWWELTPNYTTLNSSSWVDKVPNIYQKDAFRVTGKSNANYHWQSVSTINGTATAWASFGSNTESSTDFAVGSGGGGYNVQLSSMMPFFRP